MFSPSSYDKYTVNAVEVTKKDQELEKMFDDDEIGAYNSCDMTYIQICLSSHIGAEIIVVEYNPPNMDSGIRSGIKKYLEHFGWICKEMEYGLRIANREEQEYKDLEPDYDEYSYHNYEESKIKYETGYRAGFSMFEKDNLFGGYRQDNLHDLVEYVGKYIRVRLYNLKIDDRYLRGNALVFIPNNEIYRE